MSSTVVTYTCTYHGADCLQKKKKKKKNRGKASHATNVGLDVGLYIYALEVPYMYIPIFVTLGWLKDSTELGETCMLRACVAVHNNAESK